MQTSCAIAKGGILGVASMLALATSQAAYAQNGQSPVVVPVTAVEDAEPILEEGGRQASAEQIIVTGTRIRGVAPVGSNVIGLDAEAIEDTGLATTTELLRSVPQISNIGMDESRTTGAQRAVANLSGASAINLRGLGVEATLVLVNGRRPPVGGGEGRFFDTTAIPAIALQRIEIVPDGSSAIYGSDAMTGVANLVTRRSFDGLLVQGRYGMADDLTARQASALAGTRWADGNFLVAGEFYRRDNLSASDRPTLYNDTGFGSFAAAPANIGPASSPTAQFRDANNNNRLDPGEASAANPAVRQSNWLGVDALPEQQRYSVLAHADQQIGGFRLDVDGFFSRREFRRLQQAVTLSGQTVSAVNPYNATGAPVVVNYSLINDLGNAVNDGFTETWQVAIGGELNLTDNWRLAGFVSRGRDDNYRERDQLNNGALTPALASSNPATAFNPFGPNTRAVLDAVTQRDVIHPVFDLTNAQLQLDGSLFELPGGPLRIAIGGEYQELIREQLTGFKRPTGNPPPVFAPDISREVLSAFGELFVPIFGAANSAPFARDLDLSLAVRYDKYTDLQFSPALTILETDTINPKVGVRYKPFEDLTIRGSWGKSFRAPVLGDYSLGAPTSTGPVVISAAVAAANGLPSLPAYTGVQIQGGHTLGLDPERSETWTAGFDWTPDAVPGLVASVTYYNIKFSEQIGAAASTSQLTDPAYVASLRSADSLIIPGQGWVIFNPTTAQVQAFLAHGGNITARLGPPAATVYGSGSAPLAGQTTAVHVLVEALSHNGGILKTDGLDFSLQYAIETGFGRITLADYFTYILNYEQSQIATAPLVDYLNQTNFPLRFVNRGQIGLEAGGFSANAFVNYQNSYLNTTVTPQTKVDSYTTVDLTLSYDTGDSFGSPWLNDLTLSVIGQNIFDAAPPFARVVQGVAIQNFDAQNASAIGRLISFQVTKRF